VDRRARGSSAALENEPEHGGQAYQGPMSADELLSTSPYSGDIDAELAAVPKKARLPGPTLYLMAAVVAVTGFLGGIQADRTWGGSTSTSASTARRPSGAMTAIPGGMGGAGSAGGATGTTGATVGTVEKIVGKTIYLKTTSGTTVKVTTGDSTKVTVSKSGKAKDLKAGSTIEVRGSTGSDGTVTATTVTQGSGASSSSGAPSGGAGGAG